MTKYELLNAISRYEGKARRAEQKWQESGERKYYREQITNEELADAMRMAYNASDDHEFMKLMQIQISDWGLKVQRGENVSESVERFAVQHDLIPAAVDWSKVK